jgi:hypothetical protein
MATDSGSLNHPPLQSTVIVNITIEDSNDNAPRFAMEVMKFEVVENLPAGVEVGQIIVTDPDLGLGGEVELIMQADGEGEGEGRFCSLLCPHGSFEH